MQVRRTPDENDTSRRETAVARVERRWFVRIARLTAWRSWFRRHAGQASLENGRIGGEGRRLCEGRVQESKKQSNKWVRVTPRSAVHSLSSIHCLPFTTVGERSRLR